MRQRSVHIQSHEQASPPQSAKCIDIPFTIPARKKYGSLAEPACRCRSALVKTAARLVSRTSEKMERGTLEARGSVLQATGADDLQARIYSK
jgi:hypothetical protein